MNPVDAEFGEQLRHMKVSGTSPDGQIRALISGDMTLRITFARGVWEWADERTLSRQLSGLATNVWVAWERERREIYRRSQSLTAEEAEQERRTPGDSRQRDFAAGLRALECEGISPSAVLHIRTRGMINWQVEIKNEALRQFREQEFIDEAIAAFADLMRDRERRLILLKAEHYDLGIPRAWQERLR
jgi:hypothetical protein